MAAPLDGVRVIDLTRVLAGPFCTMLLGDLGAEVIKIEPAEGDPIRQQSTGALRGYFASYNRNKKSICLDLYQDFDRDALKRLLATADVLVENFSAAFSPAWAWARRSLRGSIRSSSFAASPASAATGPCRPASIRLHRPGHERLHQRHRRCRAADAGPPIADLVAGLYGALGIAAALLERKSSGEGQYVQTSLLNGLISFLSFFGASYLESGVLPERAGNGHFVVAPYGLFEAADGPIAIAPSNEAVLGKFLTALDLTELFDEPAFATNAGRLAHRGEINARVNAVLRSGTRSHWVRILQRGRGSVWRSDVAFGDFIDGEHARAHDMVMSVPDGANGPPVRITGFPVSFRTPCSLAAPPPVLGAHTADILGRLLLN